MLHQRYVLLTFVVASLLIGVAAQSATVSLFEQFAIADLRLGGFVNVTTLLSIASAALVFAGLIRSPRAVTYFDEVLDELFKVTWPTRDETLRAATTVVVTTLMIASLIGVYDLLWKNLADIFLYNNS